jgi:hypothetical protein
VADQAGVVATLEGAADRGQISNPDRAKLIDGAGGQIEIQVTIDSAGDGSWWRPGAGEPARAARALQTCCSC